MRQTVVLLLIPLLLLPAFGAGWLILRERARERAADRERYEQELRAMDQQLSKIKAGLHAPPPDGGSVADVLADDPGPAGSFRISPTGSVSKP